MYSVRQRLVAGLLIVTFACCTWSPSGRSDDPRVTPLVRAVRHCMDSVVNIHTEKAAPDSKESRFFTPKSRRVSGMGTGIVVDERGYIVTNYHVIHDVDQITVTLKNGETLTAQKVSFDRKHDMAIIRVEASEPLTVMPLGTSCDVMLAENVFAVGNAFGYEHTVTSGIVSAIGRDVEVDETQSYENLIQTDASINPGNSGGPLINMKGDVIGINTAIISQSGGNVGIGFAIPSNLVMEIVQQLKDKGKVTRGWLGVMIQKITPDLADSFGLKEASGALVNQVAPRGPAEKGGILRGDVIVKFENRKISSIDELPRLVASVSPGTRVALEVVREGRVQTVHVTIEELTPSDARA